MMCTRDEIANHLIEVCMIFRRLLQSIINNVPGIDRLVHLYFSFFLQHIHYSK